MGYVVAGCGHSFKHSFNAASGFGSSRQSMDAHCMHGHRPALLQGEDVTSCCKAAASTPMGPVAVIRSDEKVHTWARTTLARECRLQCVSVDAASRSVGPPRCDGSVSNRAYRHLSNRVRFCGGICGGKLVGVHFRGDIPENALHARQISICVLHFVLRFLPLAASMMRIRKHREFALGRDASRRATEG